MNFLYADYAQIRDVQERYFQCVDRGDEAGVRACFAPGLQATYGTRPPVTGLDAMMEQTLSPFLKRLKAGEVKLSTHFMGDFRIERLEGAVAETETYAIGVHVMPGTPDKALSMWIRYLDRFTRGADGWKISKRRMTMDWNCELPTLSAVSMATRVMGMGK